MKMLTVLFGLLGMFVIVYSVTIKILHAPPPPAFVQPDWSVDRYGRPHPMPNWNPPPGKHPNTYP